MMKKYIKTIAMALVMALVVTMFVPFEKAEAATALTQPAIYTDKIVVNINPDYRPSDTIDAFYVDLQTNSENFIRINKKYPGNSSQLTVTGVSPANSYNIKVSCDYTTASGEKKTGHPIGSIYDAAMAPTKVTGLKQDVWYCDSGKLNTVWNKQSSTSGYQYQLYNYKNRVAKKGTIANDFSAWASFEKLPSQTYKMRVRAYTSFNGKDVYGAWSSWLNIVPPVKNLKGKTKDSRKQVTVKWSKVKGASSYTIYVSTNSNSGFKKTKTVSANKTKAVINSIGKKRFKLNKTYYIMVRPNKKVGGKTYYSKPGKNCTYPYLYIRFYKTWY